ncbi:hypothetical protein Tco_0260352 [Tanacetum coccineum]
MLETKAYQTYYAFASGEKTPKPKYIRKKANSDTSPKKKPVQATKGTRLKSKAKVAKPDKKKRPAKKTKAKGLAVLSKVASTEAEQIKLATKRSKKDFHVSHASGSGDGVDTQSKVPDEQQQKTSGTDEGTDTMPGVPDVPIYESESDKESWGDSEDDDDDDDDQTEHEEEDDRVRTSSNYELTDDEETMDDEEDDEVIKDLYDDLNVNLGNDDTKMTDADQGASEQQNISKESGFNQVEKDAHVIITLVIEARKADEPVQSSLSPLSFTSKVSALESQMSEFRQTNQFAEAVSSISGIVDTYLASKMKEAVDVAVQLQTNKLIEEAQAENQEFLSQVDSTMKAIIKDQVKAQVSKIMPKIEKYVTESLGAEVMVRSTNQPQMSYAVAASLS